MLSCGKNVPHWLSLCLDICPPSTCFKYPVYLLHSFCNENLNSRKTSPKRLKNILRTIRFFFQSILTAFMARIQCHTNRQYRICHCFRT